MRWWKVVPSSEIGSGPVPYDSVHEKASNVEIIVISSHFTSLDGFNITIEFLKLDTGIKTNVGMLKMAGWQLSNVVEGTEDHEAARPERQTRVETASSRGFLILSSHNHSAHWLSTGLLMVQVSMRAVIDSVIGSSCE